MVTTFYLKFSLLERFALRPRGSSSRMRLCPFGTERKRLFVLDLRYWESREDLEYRGKSAHVERIEYCRTSVRDWLY